MKISRLTTLLTLAAALTVTGCSNGSGSGSSSTPGASSAANASSAAPSGKKTTITFWAAAVTPERNAFFEGIVKKFEEQNPNIHVDYLGVPGDLSAYEQKLDVAIAAGQAPDITNDFKADYIARGAYEPLDDYFNKWDGKASISAGALQSNRLLDQKEGKLYALPYSSQTWNLWVRPDWFKEANLQLPDTWSQFFDALPKLTDKSKDRYALSIRGGAGSANTLEALMYTYSGISDYFTADGKATINDPKNVEFVEKYLGAYNVYTPEDDLNKGWTELAATFQSGKAGIVVHNLGSASSHEKAFNGDRSKFMALPFPKNDKGERIHPGLAALGLTMSKTSKDKDAVWKFMTFYLSKDINSQYGKLYGEIPANNDAAKDSWVQEIPYMKSAADLLTSKDTKFSKNPYYLPGYNNVQKTMEPLIQKVMAKKMTAKELLDEWAKQLEKEKAAYAAKK
ncbi:ABC transporter substrate-binding protein [Paenibacillus whitsoniae]|uniref:Sugar ABC transporter substrate-binding protein n=1 Tax=Paenibacillus whitsoniae TaxID=2496558 RepID=A0A3S0IDT5_9BACL|nr:sugar ABC transporter substrate-binding protein [Paenibacillus whitsoniae]RTE10731.1 sugar ABC transporter substrate-binding protein [Paenibacillus whitsoniae]